MIYIVLLFILFLIGIPICFSLGLVSVFGMAQGATPMIVVIQRLFTGADSTALIAGKYSGMYVFCGDYWFGHCSYRCYRRNYDSDYERKEL